MIYPDRMTMGEWIRDARLRALGRHLQLLILMLRHLCDRDGRFDYSPADVHRALYASVENNVSARDVETWLEVLRSGGFIKSYTGSKGRRVGEISRDYWRQKLSFGKSLFEAEGEQPQLELGAPEPPRPKPRKRREEDVSDALAEIGPLPFRKGVHTHTPRKTSHLTSLEPKALEEYLDHLGTQFPGVNIRGEIPRATAYVRRTRGASAKLTLKYFEEQWLPRAGGPSLAEHAPIERIPDEPEYWREMVNEEFPGSDYARGGSKEGTAWANLDADIRRHFMATLPRWLKQTGRAA